MGKKDRLKRSPSHSNSKIKLSLKELKEFVDATSPVAATSIVEGEDLVEDLSEGISDEDQVSAFGTIHNSCEVAKARRTISTAQVAPITDGPKEQVEVGPNQGPSTSQWCEAIKARIRSIRGSDGSIDLSNTPDPKDVTLQSQFLCDDIQGKVTSPEWYVDRQARLCSIKNRFNSILEMSLLLKKDGGQPLYADEHSKFERFLMEMVQADSKGDAQAQQGADNALVPSDASNGMLQVEKEGGDTLVSKSDSLRSLVNEEHCISSASMKPDQKPGFDPNRAVIEAPKVFSGPLESNVNMSLQVERKNPLQDISMGPPALTSCTESIGMTNAASGPSRVSSDKALIAAAHVSASHSLAGQVALPPDTNPSPGLGHLLSNQSCHIRRPAFSSDATTPSVGPRRVELQTSRAACLHADASNDGVLSSASSKVKRSLSNQLIIGPPDAHLQTAFNAISPLPRRYGGAECIFPTGTRVTTLAGSQPISPSSRDHPPSGPSSSTDRSRPLDGPNCYVDPSCLGVGAPTTMAKPSPNIAVTTGCLIQNLKADSSNNGTSQFAHVELEGPMKKFNELFAHVPGLANHADSLNDEAPAHKANVPTTDFPLGYVSHGLRSENLTLKVPKDLIAEGSSEWATTLVGYFIGKGLPYSLVSSTTERLWADYGFFDTLATDSGFFFFTFSSEEMKDAVLEGGPWYIAGQPLILHPWKPGLKIDKKAVHSIPIWVNLYGIPLELWNPKGISFIASYIGKPL